MSNLFANEWAWSLYAATTSEERQYLKEMFDLDPILHTTRIYYNKIEGRVNLPSYKGYTPLYPEDAMFTPNTFKNSKNTQNELDNLFLVRSIAIDIDFNNNPVFSGRKAKEVWEYLLECDIIGSKIPPPSYIEYGHNFRLIYILSENVCVGTKNDFNTLKAIIKRICYIINEYDFYAEPQKLNAFYRYPGSTNTKDGSVVRVEQVSNERFTFQEFFDYLPDLPEWYEKWKNNKETTVTKNGKLHHINNKYSLCKERLAYFISLAKSGYDGNRYNLCYLYAQHLAQIDEYSLEKVYEFNELLRNPLLKKELSSKLHYIKKYRHRRYKNETINELLGVEMMTKREMERQAKILAGTTRTQLAEANYQKAKALREQGLTRAAIAKELGLKERQVSNYFKRMKEEKGDKNE